MSKVPATGTIRRCSHSVYIATGDSESVYCHLCWSGSIYSPSSLTESQLMKKLEDEHLGISVGRDEEVLEGQFPNSPEGAPPDIATMIVRREGKWWEKMTPTDTPF